MTDTNALTRLHRFIVDYYSLDDLRTLCFELSLDYDELGSGGKSAQARELLLLVGREQKLETLLQALQGSRPGPFQRSGFNLEPATLAALYDAYPALEAGVEHDFVQRVARFFRGGVDDQRAFRNRRTMLERVKNTWVTGVLDPSLHGAVLLQLAMAQQMRAGGHGGGARARAAGQFDRPLTPGTDVAQFFDQTNGALLILGAPGSGKTTVLLELARDLIARAENDLTQPMPVVLNLSSWASKEPAIAQWLVDELNVKYKIPADIGRPWVEHNDLLLLLDGLDEVRTERRQACVDALNTFRRKHGLTPLVVACRTGEYEALATPLDLEGTLALQPLTPEQVSRYLDGAGPELQAVRTLLAFDAPLQALAQTPLMLSVMALAYRGLSAEELGSLDTAEERRRHVFENYVKQMVWRRADETRHPSGPALGWLAWLAGRIQHTQTEFLIEHLQPAWLATRVQRRWYALGTWLVCGLAFGLPTGLAAGLSFGEAVGQARGMPLGLAAGLGLGLGFSFVFFQLASRLLFWLGTTLVAALSMALPIRLAFGDTEALIVALVGGLAGLVFGLFSGLLRERDRIRPIERLEWSWVNAALGLAIGVILGQVLGLVGEGLFGVRVAQSGRLGAGLWVGAVLAVVRGLTGSAKQIRDRQTPNQGIRRSAQNALLVGLAAGLAVGLPVGISKLTNTVIEVPPGRIYVGGPIDGVTVGLLAGLVLAMLYGGISVCQHLVLRLTLWRSGHMPWNVADFLDYAADLILLRKVGGGYIFFHGLLRDYLAALTEEQVAQLARELGA